MTIAEFDHLTEHEQFDALLKCCGSRHWVQLMMDALPFEDLVNLLEAADDKWQLCSEQDYLEAFTHHPKIGDVESLKQKFASTAAWASGEQAGVKKANEEVLNALASGNKDYEQKFGFIFIVCATGKSAEEMLLLLQSRLPNDQQTELKIAAAEQAKITRIRLEKLFA